MPLLSTFAAASARSFGGATGVIERGWDTAYQTAICTYSGFANRRVTWTNLGVPGAGTCRSKTFHTGGKYYAEVSCITLGGNFGNSTGLIDAAFAAASFLTSSGSDSIALRQDNGTIGGSGTSSSIGSAPAYGVGDHICIATDMSAKLIWFRINSGNWNNSGAANPTTAVGGLSFSGIGSEPFYLGQSLALSALGQVYDLCGTRGSFAYSAPAGFLEWDQT